MSETIADDGESSTDLEINVTKRRFMQASAIGGAVIATGSVPALAADFGSETIDFTSDYAHDPSVPGTIVVESHESDFGALDYIDDSSETRSLRDDGYVLAEAPDEETPHNPVTLRAADFNTAEYRAFPRGAVYDESGDGDAETDVRVVDATHWTADDSGTSGTLEVTDGDGETLVFSATGQGSGDTAVASFDLSSVADSDRTIEDGMSRLFVQLVADVDTLADGATLEVAAIDSGSNEVTAEIGSDLLDGSEGPSQVGQVRVGELETAQSEDLADIQTVEIRASAADAELTIHGFNLERSSEWEFGTEEYTNSDDELDTRTVTEPSGEFSITSLASLGSPFGSAAIDGKTLDVEQRASELPAEQQHVRVKDLGEAYDYPHEIEAVYEFVAPSAYELDVSHESLEDVGRFPGSRYLAVEAATGVSELEEWADLEDVTWTERTGDYGSPGDEVELLSSVSASDRTVSRHRVQVREGEAGDLTSGGGAAVGIGGNGGGGIGSLWTIVLGLVAGLGVWKRKAISAIFG